MNYKSVIEQLTNETGSVKLMAVSKTRSIEEIMAVYECGIRLFGENHVQEIVEKFPVTRPSDIEVHMIGHLQTNKVSKVVPLVDMIESVDSYNLLCRINSCAEKNGKVMPVLLEFNTSEEENKSGFTSEEELYDCIEKSACLKNIKIKGLMTVGPLHSDTETAFRYLADIRNNCAVKFPETDFSELSMGMSSDYLTGIKCGATEVRIGTKIFGARNYV